MFVTFQPVPLQAVLVAAGDFRMGRGGLAQALCLRVELGVVEVAVKGSAQTAKLLCHITAPHLHALLCIGKLNSKLFVL